MATDGGGWRYAPYGCRLPLWGEEGAWGCLAGKWLVFHGDSTVEENALGFIRDLLGGHTHMKKDTHRDPWRWFDAVVFRNRTVVLLPNGTGGGWTAEWRPPVAPGQPAPVRITMNFAACLVRNPGCWMGHSDKDTLLPDALSAYTLDCALPQDVVHMFRMPRPPDVFVVNSLLWGLPSMAGHLPQWSVSVAAFGHLLRAAHALSPATRFIWRTSNGAAGTWRMKWDSGAHMAEAGMHRVLEGLLPLAFLRVVDIYDLTQPWSMSLDGDGHHYSPYNETRFVHDMMLQVLVHEMCRP